MAISYYIDAKNGVVRETWGGNLTGKDIADYWHRLGADSEAIACGRSIADCRYGLIQFTKEELYELSATMLEPIMKEKGWRSAIVVNRGQHHYFATGHANHAAGFMKSGVFLSVEEALDFVLARDDAG